MEDKPLISIILPTYNRCQSLRLTLLSLINQRYDLERVEVIVVDNDSTDDTHEMVTHLETPYRIVYLTVKKQKAYECATPKNRGAFAASGELLIFLDSDIVAARDFLKAHELFHLRFKRLAVGGKLVHLDSNHFLTDDTILSDFTAKDLGKGYILGGSTRRFLEMSGNLSQYTCPWNFSFGGNFSIRRETFQEIGPLDESTDGDYPGGSDVTYMIRLKASGVRVAYARNAIGFLQKTIPLRFNDDPMYFSERRKSVRYHYDRTLRQYLPPEELKMIMNDTIIKERLNNLAGVYGLRQTFEIERRIVRRIQPLVEAQGRLPDLSIFLIYDSSEGDLEQVLLSLDRQLCDRHRFEVIVLDPLAASDHFDARHLSPAEVIAQGLPVGYLLRYFPAGPTLSQASPTTADPAEGQRREDHLYTLLHEKPFGVVAICRLISEGPVPPDFIAKVLSSYDEAIGMQSHQGEPAAASA
jgi:glycosyltransferase involved in cell wall biosynthesis